MKTKPVNPQHYMSAAQAAEVLGISMSTLYSYVSRGLIRSEEASGKTRNKRYRAEDIQALLERKAQRGNPARAAAAALHFGDPVLESAITLIDDGRLYYRGQEVTRLATSHSFEEVTLLLWSGTSPVENLFSAPTSRESGDVALVRALQEWQPDLEPVERLQTLLPPAASGDLAAYSLTPDAVMRSGVRILRLMTTIISGGVAGAPIAADLAAAWAPHEPAAPRLLDAALIMCADHELNVSSFTARCVASAGSTPYAVVSAGLAALQGPKHGGHTVRAQALFREATTGVESALAARLRQGQSLPGFGHPLYAEGDPRGRYLIDLVTGAFPTAPATATLLQLMRQVAESTGLQPTVDFGLVAVAQALNLPPSAPLTLFALGRISGWLGQAIEQYQADRMIRPRARYVGVPPASNLSGSP